MKKLFLFIIICLLANISYAQNTPQPSKAMLREISKEAILKYGEKLFWDDTAICNIKLEKLKIKSFYFVSFFNEFAREVKWPYITRVAINAATTEVEYIDFGTYLSFTILDKDKKFDRKIIFPDELRKKYLNFLVQSDKLTKEDAKSMAKPEVFKDNFDSSVRCNYQAVGVEAITPWLRENVTYPMDLQNLGIKGQVKIRFIVNEDASFSDFEVLSSPHGKLTEEVIKALKKYPTKRITPARSDDKYVPTYSTVSITFNK